MEILIHVIKSGDRYIELSKSRNSNNIEINPLKQISTNEIRIYDSVYNIDDKLN